MESRLTFLTPIKINIPFSIYDTVIKDAAYFGFFKNNMANINGFLNELLPSLAIYRETLREKVMYYSDYDFYKTFNFEINLYKIYYNIYDFCDEDNVSIHLRVNSKHYNEFIEIHDVQSSRYAIDFSNYIKSLLLEYTSKRLFQREYLFFYKNVKRIKNYIEKNISNRFYTKNAIINCVPLFIKQSPKTSKNYIIGYDNDNKKIVSFALKDLKNIIEEDYYAEYDDDVLQNAHDYFKNIIINEDKTFYD